MRPDELARRCKRIYIREKGLQLDEMMHQTVRSTEERMVQGFTEDEKAQFADLLRRARSAVRGVILNDMTSSLTEGRDGYGYGYGYDYGSGKKSGRKRS